jgi:hypothetical protein
MKNIFMSTVVLIVFATSISALAQSGGTRRDDPDCTSTQQSNHQTAGSGNQDQTSKSKADEEEQKEIQKEDREWDHDLMGIFG